MGLVRAPSRNSVHSRRTPGTVAAGLLLAIAVWTGGVAGCADEGAGRKNPDGGRTFEFPGGGSVTKPPPPARTELPPEPGCSRRSSRASGAAGPPRPGLRAELVGNEVRVSYRFAEVPQECRPATVVIGIGTSRGIETAPSTQVDVSFPGGQEVIPVPEHWRHRPDVASAGAMTADGTAGPAGTVRIP
jgi:hypothetical protein